MLLLQLIFAFMMGITISIMRSQKKGETTFNLFAEYEEIISKILAGFVIPLLPFHILGIFSEMAYSGIVFKVLGVFAAIYLCIFAMHYIYMLVMFSIAGGVLKEKIHLLVIKKPNTQHILQQLELNHQLQLSQ